MRDTLSLLDRLLASGQDPLTAEGLATLLGLPDRQWIEKIVDAIADADAGAALEHFGSMLEKGVALDQALEGLTECWRQLMLISACGADSSLVELDEASRQSATQCAGRFATAQSRACGSAAMENVQRLVRGPVRASGSGEAACRCDLLVRERFADLAGLLAGSGSQNQKKNIAAPPRPIPVPVKPSVPSAAMPRPVAAPIRPAGPSPAPGSNAPKSLPPTIERVPAVSASLAVGTGQVSREERDRVMKLPLVKQVQELFDAKLVDIRPRVEPPKSDPDVDLEEEA